MNYLLTKPKRLGNIFIPKGTVFRPNTYGIYQAEFYIKGKRYKSYLKTLDKDFNEL